MQAAAVPADAPHMRRYMKDQFEFFGTKAPARRRATLPLLRRVSHEPGSARAVVDALWKGGERELQYVACDLLELVALDLDQTDLSWLGSLVLTKSWWDTVDGLASKVIGAAALQRREMWPLIDGWADHGPDDERMWLARASLLQQLRYKELTDQTVLFDRCRRRAGDSEFFIRKAIGWALRQYARTDPEAVRGFVDAHRRELSGLTVREATKHL